MFDISKKVFYASTDINNTWVIDQGYIIGLEIIYIAKNKYKINITIKSDNYNNSISNIDEFFVDNNYSSLIQRMKKNPDSVLYPENIEFIKNDEYINTLTNNFMPGFPLNSECYFIDFRKGAMEIGKGTIKKIIAREDKDNFQVCEAHLWVSYSYNRVIRHEFLYKNKEDLMSIDTKDKIVNYYMRFLRKEIEKLENL